ncbi:SDR family NAD(P)-dependent oxidoreductase [Gordonia hydrophobica]|uniref:SDR family NAD(P)-dependent oxidoreductase n=1 Tax=Gordonia hydrophobica TaxID=40516 RepID=A0ABZ2U6Q8_9ACTN|nr:SDR family NAD(P)-dependent oxidoreductase [Gordonia hydrophobica]MBM7365381.1 NAD(P)-dependent dehydrogenase (short-subunit alcohol dehydrogenase family) [Gordonia hydrophobica]
MTGARMIVTGAASGIGRSIAEIAAADGSDLLLVDVDAVGLNEVVAELQGRDGRVGSVVADLTDPDEPGRVVREAERVLGGLDALMSNAGAAAFATMKDLDVATFDRMVALNVRATWLLAQAAHPLLSASQGSIVATASICGHHPAPPQGAYSVAKAGLLMLVRQLALEWGPDGIRVNSVSPGPTITGATAGVFNDMSDPRQRAIREKREANLPLRRIGQPDDVARAAIFLAGDAASQITGQDLLVDGGMSTVLMLAAGVAEGR